MSDTSFSSNAQVPTSTVSEHIPLQSFPTAPHITLSQEDKDLIAKVEAEQPINTSDQLSDTFYRGEQLIQDLGIAIPKDISDKIRSIVGWPRQAVDPYVDRMAVDGFRLAGATDADESLGNDWSDNGMDAELPSLLTDALSIGRGILMAGTNPDKGGTPLLTVESPLTMRVLWDVPGRKAEAALQHYKVDNREYAALVAPDRTVQLARDDDNKWTLVNRDDHGFGWVPIVRVANNPRSNNRNGFSEITPELRSLVADACHAMLGLKVAGQIYSVPRLALMGATEAAFTRSDGSAASIWETYITLVLGIERDEDGELPTLQQLQVYDPGAFTKVIELYAAQAAGVLSAPPQDLGLYTDGNPISQESWAASEGRRDRRARRKAREFGVNLVSAMQMVQRFKHNGDLPDEFRRIQTDWHPVEIPTPAITSQAVAQEISSGAIPATSDVTLKRLGYSALERQRLEQDRKVEQRRTNAAAIVDALQNRRPDQTAPPAPVTPQGPTSVRFSG